MREDKNMGIMITLKKPTLERWPDGGTWALNAVIHAARQELHTHGSKNGCSTPMPATCWSMQHVSGVSGSTPGSHRQVLIRKYSFPY